TGGAAARDLYRLAAAQNVGRNRCRRVVRVAGHAGDAGSELAVCQLRIIGTCGRVVLRVEGGGARGGDRGRGENRAARAQEPLHGGARGGGFSRDLSVQGAVSVDRRGRGSDWRRCAAASAAVLRAGVVDEVWSGARFRGGSHV